TTRPGSVGDDVGSSFFGACAALEPGKVIVRGVNNYPADTLGYHSGVSDFGATDTADSVQWAASECPNSEI
ncbi:hypothetical protein HOY82DRAFT_468990, partial [Tuber indicum]